VLQASPFWDMLDRAGLVSLPPHKQEATRRGTRAIGPRRSSWPEGFADKKACPGSAGASDAQRRAPAAPP